MKLDGKPIGQDWDRSGLPGWTYFSEELHELEREEVFRKMWQLVCHANDVPETGDFMTLDIAGERGFVVRGSDGQVRAFHNLCRHRGSRVLAEEQGSCGSVITCPFHGWSYNLDGSLRGMAVRNSFPGDVDKAQFSLKPLEMEIWKGFVFVRFKPSEQASVAELLSGFDEETAHYNLEDIQPTGEEVWVDEMPVNWKSVRDVDNEGYHVKQAHPGLQDLYGGSYHDEVFSNGTSRSVGVFREGEAALWSVKAYRSILPEATWLPESHRKAWVYIGMFPNLVIGLYPDSITFYQELPVSSSRTIQRGAVYRFKDEDRQLKVARYLSGRIDRDTVEEDQMLTVWSCEGAKSSAYDEIYLSDLEYGLKSHHDQLRSLIPVMNCTEEPAIGSVAKINQSMKTG